MAYKTPNKTSEYIRSIMSKEEDSLLCEIMKEADKLNIPILLPEAAEFLKQLVLLKKPLNVLEIGTAIGYSGILFLKHSGCFLTTLEKNEEYILRARYYFDRAGFLNRYRIIQGDAGESIKMLEDKFDLIFLDGPKGQYVNYLKVLPQLLSDGGVLLADNVLFNGMVARETEPAIGKKSIIKNLDLFLNALYGDNRFITSVLNVGDGMSLSIKLP